MRSLACRSVRDRDGRAPRFAEVKEEGRPFRPGPGDMEQSGVPCRPDPVLHETTSFASLRMTRDHAFLPFTCPSSSENVGRSFE